jgi:hypothetical protein
MSEITVDRKFTAQSMEALHHELKQAVGDKLIRLTLAKGIPTVGLSNDATIEDDNTVRQILLTFDLSKRTPEQEARAERKRLREAARVKAKGDKPTKDELIEYLMLQVEYLSERLGEL